jgi:prohibitin 2
MAMGSVSMLTGISMCFFMVKNSFYRVDPGFRAFKFNKITGVQENIFREGWHFKIPAIEKPIIMDIRARPRSITSATGSADLQTVNISLRVMFKPDEKKLFSIYRNLGLDYDGRVLPSVVHEILKSVVARYTVAQLAHQREQVSAQIRVRLTERLREFMIELDDVAITELSFSPQYQRAVE